MQQLPFSGTYFVLFAILWDLSPIFAGPTFHLVGPAPNYLGPFYGGQLPIFVLDPILSDIPTCRPSFPCFSQMSLCAV